MKVYLGHPVDGVSCLYPYQRLESKDNLSSDSRMVSAEKEGSDKAEDIPENDGNNQLAYGKREL